MPALEEVFGIRREPVLSYVSREQVDGTFNRALRSDNHIVIYGSSKQGKTSLRQKHLPEGQSVIVRCDPHHSAEDIYSSVLRQAGVKIETFEQTQINAKAGAKAKFGLRALIPFGTAKAEAEGAVEAGGQVDFHREFIGSDIADAQAVTELLHEVKFNKFVVLENFHYLPLETQQAVAFGLKTFHEVGIRFIILGIWREANLLVMHNGDLQDRVIDIPVEPWEDTDFDQVMTRGSSELKIQIADEAGTAFKNNAYGNVGMFQEFLKVFCEVHGVTATCQSEYALTANGELDTTFDRKLAAQRGHLLSALQHIAGRSRTDGDDPLILPYYLTKVLLTVDFGELLDGIHRRELLLKIRDCHHRQDKDTIRPGDISHLLKRLPAYQEQLHPPLVYYDSNLQRLKIVDTRQFFVLSRIDRAEMFEEIPNPLDVDN